MTRVNLPDAFEAGFEHHQAGRLAQAEQLYRQALQHNPRHAEALHFLGVLAQQVGRHDVAVELIQQALQLRPNWPVALSNLSEALRAIGRLDEAVAACHRAIALRPDLPEPHSNLAIYFLNLGRFQDAADSSRRALALRPDFPEALCNYANALQELGSIDEAIAAYRRAIALRPDYGDAYANLARALLRQSALEEGLAACQQAVRMLPTSAAAWNVLADLLLALRRLDEAIDASRRSLALQPDLATAMNTLASALKEQGLLDEAVATLRQAVAVQPDRAYLHSNLIQTMLFHPGCGGREMLDECRRYEQRHVLRPAANAGAAGHDRNPDRILRIGYVSPDFRDHVVGRNVLPLFRCHDRRQVEITCYSNVHSADAITREFQQLSLRWRPIVGISDAEVARQIRADGIDILVDLAMHLSQNRLPMFGHKPAPVQVTFAAYPGTTGLSAIDYRLSDPYLDPPGGDESAYCNQTLRLPHSFWCYDPLECADLQTGDLPALRPNNPITFGCLNNFCKVNEGVLQLWANVLRQVPGSRLLMMAPEGSHRARTLQRLQQLEIEPGRIGFVPLQRRRSYMQVYHQIDLGLDTFPYNGHTTSLDSLWMGVPVVSLSGQQVVSRAGFSQLSNLGLPHLAAQSPDQFVQIATTLAGDLPQLAQLRQALRGKMEQSPLMDAVGFAAGIEAAYRQIWRQWCSAR
jgi:predicted O-linked N-acetylglucosamine transferase (SPINDLY family)